MLLGMFQQVSDTLEEAISALDIPVDGDAIVRSLNLRDRHEAKIVAAVGDYDAAKLAADDGSVSTLQWLCRHAGIAVKDANWLIKAGRRLRQLPVTARHYLDGELTTGQVKAILANVTDRTVERFVYDETDIVPTVTRLDVAGVSRAMQYWKQRAEAELDDDTEPADTEQTLHVSKTLDGRREVSGSLNPESGAVLETALRLATRPDLQGEPERSPARRRADALEDVARFFLDNQQANRGGRHRPHLNVFLKYDDIVRQAPAKSETLPDLAEHHDDSPVDHAHGWLADGTVLNRQSIRRLLCDSAIHRIVAGPDGAILDYGRSTRSISAAVFAALIARDHHCRYPGCDRPAHWCEAHHLVPWEEGGVTSLLNLALFCVAHHHLLHTPGWNAKMRNDGVIEITTAHGQILESHTPDSLYNLLDDLIRKAALN
jgi:uncharacterized protein DUF222